MEESTYPIPDPHDDKMTVRAIVAGDRANIANLIVDFEYEDPEAGIHETGTLQFDSENLSKPQSWEVHLADPTKRRYRYRMTLVSVSGEFMATGWISTDAPTLPVGEVYVRRLTVEVLTGEFDTGIESVEVKLVYDDTDGGIHEERVLSLGANARAEWQVEMQDAAKREYQATITWVREDGFNQKVGPTDYNKTLLVVPSGPPS